MDARTNIDLMIEEQGEKLLTVLSDLHRLRFIEARSHISTVSSVTLLDLRSFGSQGHHQGCLINSRWTTPVTDLLLRTGSDLHDLRISDLFMDARVTFDLVCNPRPSPKSFHLRLARGGGLRFGKGSSELGYHEY
jgi:hypothetical protein